MEMPEQPVPQTPVAPPISIDSSIIPTKPAWYNFLVGYRTVISVIVSSILKLLATRGILGSNAPTQTEDIVNIIMLLASFIADGASIWFKLRSPAPGKLAPPAAVVGALVTQAEQDAVNLAKAIEKAEELISKAKVASQRSQVARILKQGLT
jgi:hypothetical protein